MTSIRRGTGNFSLNFSTLPSKCRASPGPVDDMLEPVRRDRVVGQDRVVVFEQEPDQVRGVPFSSAPLPFAELVVEWH
ncbi:hypothetical protein LWP59_38800 [Amycolatopsis acidiphila]|uniref:Uncharacterized protein n=1 Tax=Amycolatopsis acidiphila TaxID=715473 RepID=A0A557ZZF7_9PSEU|nr:hypothetical protein [Amycolatopsis acidiphila]TVT17396.1 hypothetical protein FNH06_31725 [Amycolatopsis acidiphila]UIJ59864.1 hypothetical protein LWP59_38800 [Amycolatopsis acidiphila]GHG62742.1 hypothetical protein GCM10017788_18600 [Amycolatopsis acidiphila]